MPLLNVSLKLPDNIEDKTFEKILNDIEIDSIPTKFIDQIIIKLTDGRKVKVGPEFLQRIKNTDQIFSDTELKQFEDQTSDVEIYLNLDRLKLTIQKNVGKILTKIFKETDE